MSYVSEPRVAVLEAFFHIVKPGVTERWLDTMWNDNSQFIYYFIYYEPKLLIDSDVFVVGPNNTGDPMRYLGSDEELSDREPYLKNPGIVALLYVARAQRMTKRLLLVPIAILRFFLSKYIISSYVLEDIS